MTVTNPGRPCRIVIAQTRDAQIDLARGDVKASLIVEGQLCQHWLAKLVAGAGNMEAATLEVTNSHAGSVGIDEVPDLTTAVGEDSGFILAVKQLAIAEEETGGDAVAERLRLEIL